MTQKFFIDECLTPGLCDVAVSLGYLATSVIYRSLAGSPDHILTRMAVDNDFAFVTNNARDYVRLYAREKLHRGLIVILPSAGKMAQEALFERVLEHLSQEPDLINKRLTINEAGIIAIADLSA